MSESRVKKAQLADYRIIHFATHATLTGEIKGTAEPGLVLTPPNNGNDIDDGYLSASEIAQLNLDAELVVLSACNTAGAEELGAEPLSGLARAFFYARARALLVSHWYVNSDATVSLMSRFFDAQSPAKRSSRAEALRQSMVSMIDGGSNFAHPSYWAPFVLVGDSGGPIQR